MPYRLATFPGLFWLFCFLADAAAFSLWTPPGIIIQQTNHDQPEHQNRRTRIRLHNRGGDVDDLEDELAEAGGDSSFFAFQNDRDFSAQDAREAEIAEILEMGGDPSFLMDVTVPPKATFQPSSSMDQKPITEKLQQLDQKQEQVAAALEAVGGGPFSLPDNAVADRDQPQHPQPTLDDNKPEDDQDWFSIGRQMAKDFLQEESSDGMDHSQRPRPLLDEEAEEDLEPTWEELEAMGGDPFFLDEDDNYSLNIDDDVQAKMDLFEAAARRKLDQEPKLKKVRNNGPTNPMEHAQIVALEAAQSLVEATEAVTYSKQQQLSAVQQDIQKLQAQFMELQKQETMLKHQVEEAVANQVKSIQKQQAVRQAFAVLTTTGADAVTMTLDTEEVENDKNGPLPGSDKGPRFTGMEGDTYDSLEDDIEAIGGDPFFLDGQENKDVGDQDYDDGVSPASSLASGPSFLLSLVQKEKGPVIDDAPNDTPTTSTFKRKILKKNPLTNEAEEEENYTQEEEMLEVGGDPAFLDSYDEHHDSGAYDQELLRAEIEEMGGDPSFL